MRPCAEAPNDQVHRVPCGRRRTSGVRRAGHKPQRYAWLTSVLSAYNSLFLETAPPDSSAIAYRSGKTQQDVGEHTGKTLFMQHENESMEG